jgi:hypothetical protein
MERAAQLEEVVSEAPSSPVGSPCAVAPAQGAFFDLDSPTAAAAAAGQENLSESLGLYIITPPMTQELPDSQQQQ